MSAFDQVKNNLAGADSQWKQPGNGKCSPDNSCLETLNLPLDGLKVSIRAPDAATMQALQKALAKSPNGELRFSGKGLWKGNEEALQKAIMPSVTKQIKEMQSGVPNGHVSVDFDKLKLKTDGTTITVLDGDAKFTENESSINPAGITERVKQQLRNADLKWKQPGNNISGQGKQALEQFDVRLDGVSFPCGKAPTANHQRNLNQSLRASRSGTMKFNGNQMWSSNEEPLRQAIVGAVSDYIKKQNPNVAIPDIDCFVKKGSIRLETDGNTIKILKGEVTCVGR